MLNYSRHFSVFDPSKFRDRVDVIGGGSIGSHITYLLASMGVRKIRVYDFDMVEEHNVPNQFFKVDDIGSTKLEALQRNIKEFTGIEIETIEGRVTKESSWRPGQYVFMVTDTMASRKELFEGFIKNNAGVKLMVECRMGGDDGRVYSIDPTNLRHVKAWEASLYDDESSAESLCGTSASVIPTSVFLASSAVWQMVRRSNGENVEEWGMLMGMRPPTVLHLGLPEED
jgi:molybdopterin/thiamine biosynthesis adenylyltransferase